MIFSFILFFLLWIVLAYESFQIIRAIEINRHGSYDWIIQFYPILFLPLFVQSVQNRLSKIDFVQLTILISLFFVSVHNSYLSLTWIASIWIGLILLKTFGWKVHFLGKSLFLLVPPFSLKYTLLFGFSLRLFLTYLVGKILQILDPNTIIHGNSLIFQGNEFIVDPACEGLKMTTGFICLLFLFFYRTRIKSMLLNFFIFIFSFVLLLFANFIRIFLLVWFNIPPESNFHYFIGLVLFFCILLYPLLLLSEFFLEKNPNSKQQAYNTKRTPILSISLVSFLILFNRLYPYNKPKQNTTTALPKKLENFQKTSPTLSEEIGIYSNQNQSFILKSNPDPLRISHHPRQCWEGVGYEIIKEETLEINGLGKLRRALLKKNNNFFPLYWWYQPIKKIEYNITDSEYEWRKNMLLDKVEYFQVNVSFKDTKNLENELLKVRNIINKLKFY